MKYKDNRWNINIATDIFIHCKCTCGLDHDITLSKNLKLIGRGTDMRVKKKRR